MPLVDITNDIKRSRLKQQQVEEEKKSSSSLKPIPSTLRRISISKKSASKDDGKEGEEEEEEQQLPPTRSKRDSLSGSGSSPFSKVSVEQPGEFLESEPSLSKSDCVSNKDEDEDEEQQNVLVQEKNHQQQQLRQSRRQKHQPQRLGDLLEWNDIKSNALYEKYDPEKAHREQQMKLLTNTHTTNTTNRVMEEEEEKRSKASDYQSGQNSKAVLEVHQRVADLMKLAEQMLPPEEADDDDGLPKKSIREKLRDAWDGDGYYAKLMKEQDSGPSSSSSSSRTSSTPPTSNGNSNNNKSKTNNSNGKKEGLKVYCDKENPVAHKVNRGAKKASGLGGGLSSSGGGGKLAVGCGNTGGGLANHAPKPLVQRTALTSALGNVTNASSSSSSNNVNATVSGSAYMFGNLKSIQAPSATQNSSSSNKASEKPTNSTPPSSSLSSSSSSSFASESSINTGLTKKDTNNTNNETLLNALKAENDLLRKQRNDVKLTHLKLKKELDDLKRNARIAVSKLCAKLPNNSRGVELDALAFLKLSS